MSNFIKEDIKAAFGPNGSRLTQIILVNVGVYIVFNLLANLITMGSGHAYDFLRHFYLPARLSSLLTHFWTPITYMFFHNGLMHLIFNMLVLYWFGKIWLAHQSPTQFLKVYFWGGLSGGLLFIVLYNLSYLVSANNTALPISAVLLGASAAVTAIVFAAATLLPNHQMRLLFIGDIRIKYVAIGLLITTSLLDFSLNTGGKIAHLGGAFFGYWYVSKQQQGRNILAPFEKWLSFNFLKGGKSPLRGMKGNAKRTKTDQEYNLDKKQRQAQVDAILDKISKSGYDSLSKDEKAFLFSISGETKDGNIG